MTRSDLSRHGRERRRLLAAAATLPPALLFASSAAAHVRFVGAQPANGATVSTAPQSFVLLFSDRVQPHLSEILVTDATGRRVGGDSPTLSQDDPKRLVVDLGPLADGAYAVNWRATCIYGHRLSGQSRFVVRAA